MATRSTFSAYESQPRPSAIALVDLADAHTSALLLGTVSGVYVTWTDVGRLGQWTRLGSCAELPLVLTLGLSYEPSSDTLVAATFGRGVYVMHQATQALQHARRQRGVAA